MKMNILCLIFYSVFLIHCASSSSLFSETYGRHKHKPTSDQDWDYLLYSQSWPITGCSQWQESGNDHTCTLPRDRSLWIVHGIWPTKVDTKGPSFCKSEIYFDKNALQPILDDLETHWTNIHAHTEATSFWKHEWDKHGTCASVLPQLDSLTNYFKQGLEWNEQYNLSEMLERNNITPGPDGYTPRQFADAVKAVTKTNPTIQCVVDRDSKESMISEIRICFDKNLEPVDCDLLTPDQTKQDGVLTNCSHKKPVMYYTEVPDSTM